MAQAITKSLSWDGNLLGLHMQEWERMFHISISYESDVSATLRYFFLGSGKLDPKDIRRTHTRSILAFSNAVDLG